jgi:hypothetical protein
LSGLFSLACDSTSKPYSLFWDAATRGFGAGSGDIALEVTMDSWPSSFINEQTLTLEFANSVANVGRRPWPIDHSVGDTHRTI